MTRTRCSSGKLSPLLQSDALFLQSDACHEETEDGGTQFVHPRDAPLLALLPKTQRQLRQLELRCREEDLCQVQHGYIFYHLAYQVCYACQQLHLPANPAGYGTTIARWNQLE